MTCTRLFDLSMFTSALGHCGRSGLRSSTACGDIRCRTNPRSSRNTAIPALSSLQAATLLPAASAGAEPGIVSPFGVAFDAEERCSSWR